MNLKELFEYLKEKDEKFYEKILVDIDLAVKQLVSVEANAKMTIIEASKKDDKERAKKAIDVLVLIKEIDRNVPISAPKYGALYTSNDIVVLYDLKVLLSDIEDDSVKLFMDRMSAVDNDITKLTEMMTGKNL